MKRGVARRPLLLWWPLLLMVGVGGGLAAWLLLPVLRAPDSDHSRGTLETLTVYGRVPEFALIDQSGRQITVGHLLGKVWIVNFFYTECTDTCTLQTANMARIQADFAEKPDVRLVSISVDPEHDTPEVLAEYANRFRADPARWLFLTGSRDAIYRLAIEGFHLGVVDRGEKAQLDAGARQAWLGPRVAWAHPFPNAERKPVIHSSRFVLVDRQAQIRGYYHGTDRDSLERLRKNVEVLLVERPGAR